ncbi:PREDICTED: prostate stem cell antigen-like [Priapulus caudatus]|uniref:Prostate stem cell antigen-like n=1 Tax=Priapulus caudatus TaxID=37621 RepID=A0ABM1DNZ4_PRICU|nr:PREDICTED: prostate stem cell antigen-like [Priapulus caudatus]
MLSLRTITSLAALIILAILAVTSSVMAGLQCYECHNQRSNEACWQTIVNCSEKEEIDKQAYDTCFSKTVQTKTGPAITKGCALRPCVMDSAQSLALGCNNCMECCQEDLCNQKGGAPDSRSSFVLMWSIVTCGAILMHFY